MLKLTKADKIILSMLEYNSRISERKIAEACHLSRDTIRYRIKRLEKEGVIQGYSTIIDYKQLGYESFKLYMRINGTSSQKKELYEFFLSLPNTFAIFESFGNWDMAVALFAKSPLEYNSLENKMLDKFGDIILERKFCSMLDAKVFEKSILLEDFKNIKIHNIWEDLDNFELDDINKKLIKLLHKNSREKYIFLAEEVGLSIDSVKKRLIKLEKVIFLKTTKINYAAMGYKKYKMLVYPEKFSDAIEQDMVEFLAGKKNTINIIRTLGEWKLEVEFLTKNFDEIDAIYSELNEKFKPYISKVDISSFKNEKILECNDLIF